MFNYFKAEGNGDRWFPVYDFRKEFYPGDNVLIKPDTLKKQGLGEFAGRKFNIDEISLSKEYCKIIFDNDLIRWYRLDEIYLNKAVDDINKEISGKIESDNVKTAEIEYLSGGFAF